MQPSATDSTISAGTQPHIVYSERASAPGPLLVFIPGTGGKTPKTAETEQAFIGTALAHGYRVIILSYIDTPAIAQVCTKRVLANDPACAEQVRQKRAFGDDTTARIDDAPQDAIVHRLNALIRYLAAHNAGDHWEQYLAGERLNWRAIVLSGQSQGGGMAAYIAKRIAIRGVIDFSGGWDMRSDNDIASWYSAPSATPPERWYGTYHADERFASAIAASYRAMNIPVSHQFSLSEPVRHPEGKNPGHGEGASNPVYRGIWETMLTGLE
ncbi:hypothetical protein C1W90_24220 [Burkholderia pseudomallei]|nr:hypothetical protein CXQ84_28370 [Burkholderia pseudomallei]MBG1249716.1 hypothetical protein [Burkholderia pseudomallei]MBK3334136.1 hypothetical protein [Burkholderia pseudomallei]MBM5579212.1 hypothetical protein [Burkholderia pseudomallei]MBM5585693.1 hypothetical protein [Burkholderia pseudomallei]